MTRSVHERVWEALTISSPEVKQMAFDEIDFCTQDPVERMVLRAMIFHEYPRDLSREEGIESVAAFTAKHTANVHSSLEAMNVAIAFPDFFDGPLPGNIDILRPQTISVAGQDHFAVTGEHTTDNRHDIPNRYRLGVHRVMRSTRDPEIARQAAQPELAPRVSLIVGFEAVKAYINEVQKWAADYPDSEATAKKQATLLAALAEDPDAITELPLPAVSLE